MLTLETMTTLFFDCFSGISGDMTVGALLDLGLDFDYLKTELKKLPVEGYELKMSRVTRANLTATKFHVLLAEEADSEHHDHRHTEPHQRSDRPHHGHHAHHAHRKAKHILEMIRASRLNLHAKKLATDIFMKLAISEGKVHDVAPEEVDFHEVGAVDSIVDTVGAAVGFDALGIGRFLCSAINVGSGFIHCQHGVMPVPAPATADLLRDATIYQKYAETELVTPTGAAILAAVVDRFGTLNGFATERIGYGAGTKEFPHFPNCLRLMIGTERTTVPGTCSSDVVVIEANIDDMIPQNFAYVTEKLLSAGALDVFTTPIHMKKGRRGELLQVLAPADAVDALTRVVFRETTTIGLRRYAVDRATLEREFVEVQTEYGSVKVKVSKLDGEVLNYAPEFDDCARIARERNVPLKHVQSLALQAYLASR